MKTELIFDPATKTWYMTSAPGSTTGPESGQQGLGHVYFYHPDRGVHKIPVIRRLYVAAREQLAERMAQLEAMRAALDSWKEIEEGGP